MDTSRQKISRVLYNLILFASLQRKLHLLLENWECQEFLKFSDQKQTHSEKRVDKGLSFIYCSKTFLHGGLFIHNNVVYTS